MAAASLKNVIIVLVGTKHPGNIGSVARAMHNMGLEQLRLVSPQCSIDEESIRMARGGKDILSGAKVFRSLKGSLKAIRLTVGTSGKTGGHRADVTSPRSLAPQILQHAARQKIAIIFGPEDTGLVDEDLLLCQRLARIRTQPQARSINLAQAVMIFCYELYQCVKDRRPAQAPPLASVENVEEMYSHLQTALLNIGFLHSKNDRHMMFALRRLLGRAGLQPADVGILRGIARQINWYAGIHRPDAKNH